jgi:hypothetical protein
VKTYWGVEVQLHAFLTSARDGGEWSASRPGRFAPRERAPSTHYIGGWVDPRVVLDAVVKRKIPSPRREPNPKTPIVQPVAQHYTDWAITALSLNKTNTNFCMAISEVTVCSVTPNLIFFILARVSSAEFYQNWTAGVLPEWQDGVTYSVALIRDSLLTSHKNHQKAKMTLLVHGCTYVTFHNSSTTTTPPPPHNQDEQTWL